MGFTTHAIRLAILALLRARAFTAVVSSKEELRKRIRSALAERSPADLRSASARICERVRDLPEWRAASRVCLFASQRSEPDVDPLLEAAREAGKNVCYPRVREQTLEIVEVSGHGDLAVSRWNLREPRGEHLRRVPTSEVCFILVPGMAFDARGYRLGRGGGFYDRLLAGLAGAATVGVCFAFQMQTGMPVEDHDMPVKVVVTESGVCRAI